MAVRQAPSWLQAGSHSAEDDRLTVQALLGGSPNTPINDGVVGATDLKVSQTETASMKVVVVPGSAFITGTEVTNQGVYTVINDADLTVQLATSDATNARIDRLVAQILDDQYSGATHIGQIVAVTGTPGPSPVAPTIPKNAISLATVRVAAGAASVSNADITDDRPYFSRGLSLRGVPAGTMAAAGGVVSIAAGTVKQIKPMVASGTLRGGVTVTTTTSAIIFPVTGLYLVTAAIYVNGASNAQPTTYLSARVTVDGITQGEQPMSSGGKDWPGCTWSAQLEVTAGAKGLLSCHNLGGGAGTVYATLSTGQGRPSTLSIALLSR